MINPERGEVGITLEGQQWLMRPTYDAISQIEAATGRPIMDLIRTVEAMRYGARDLAAIVSACIRAGGEKSATQEKVGESLVRGGLGNPEMLGAVTQLLNNMLTGGAEPKKDEAPETESSKPSGA